jgi:acetyl-CoA synthetase
MDIKKKWIEDAKVNSDTYEAKYNDSIENNESFWREQGKRIDWIKNYTKVKDVKYSKNEVVLSGIMMVS